MTKIFKKRTLKTVRFKIVAALLILVALLLSTVTVLLLLNNERTSQNERNQKNKATLISGSFDINGVIPNGATITAYAKEANSNSKPQAFVAGLPVADQSIWSFSAGEENKNYTISAEIILNGTVIATSSPLTVTAPADEEVLTLNISSQNPTGSAVISGNITVNGYIPTGSTITIQGRKLGAQTFTTVARNLPGQIRQFMSYATAVAGQTYEVQGSLISKSGDVIGTSSLITVTAPAANETLTINSSATVPTPQPTPTTSSNQPSPTPQPQIGGTISGNINFNGAAPANSRIVILTAPGNTSNYTVSVNNVTPADGSTWSWNTATPSTWYNVMAVLKQHNSDGTDTDIAYSSPVTIASPATGVVLSINSGVSLSAPGGPITVNCQQYNGGPNQNTWNVAITFQSVPGAQSYWYQVGNTSGSNNVVNTANQSNTVNTTFNNNTTYYARYAYANVPVASLGSNEWSGFSSSTSLQCSH